MSGEYGKDRLAVEAWELELAKRIAGSFRSGDEDLAAVLLERVVKLKASGLEIRRWQAFLAQSLYNAAKNFIRHEDVLRRYARSLDFGDQHEDGPSSPREKLVAPEEPVDLRIDLPKVWDALTPEMQTLWQFLLEEEGNTSAVAKRLGRPRKTVEYWIQRLRAFLIDHGME